VRPGRSSYRTYHDLLQYMSNIRTLAQLGAHHRTERQKPHTHMANPHTQTTDVDVLPLIRGKPH
jgi:hypothetical protein